MLKYQYLTYVLLNFKAALYFRAQLFTGGLPAQKGPLPLTVLHWYLASSWIKRLQLSQNGLQYLSDISNRKHHREN